MCASSQKALRALGEPLRMYQETHAQRVDRLNSKRGSGGGGGGGTTAPAGEGEEKQTWLNVANKPSEEGGQVGGGGEEGGRAGGGGGGGGGFSLDSLISDTSSSRVKKSDIAKAEAEIARAEKPAFLQVIFLANLPRPPPFLSSPVHFPRRSAALLTADTQIDSRKPHTRSLCMQNMESKP